MAATQRWASKLQRRGRRVLPALRRATRRAHGAAHQESLTVGELLAAALETSGGEVREAVRLMRSPAMQRALRGRLVFVR